MDVPPGAHVPAPQDNKVVNLESKVGTVGVDQSLSKTDSSATSGSPNTAFVMVGRNETADLRVSHASVGRKHAALYYVDNDLYLKDLGSKYGVTVNGSRLPKEQSTRLADGDAIFFGKVKDCAFTVRYPSKDSAQQALDTSSDNSQAAVSNEKASQTPIEEIGAGLEGRAKRKAEIDAMVASLSETPTYKVVKVDDDQPIAAVRNETKEDTIAKLAKHYKLPITRRLDLPAENAGKSNELLCLAIEASGARVCLGGRDTHLRLYDFGGLQHSALGPFVDFVPDDGHWIVDAVFGGKQQLLVATGSVQPRIFTREGQEVVQFVRGDSYVSDPTKTKGHTAAVTGVDWHPIDNNMVITCSSDCSARLWKLNGPTSFKMLLCHKVFVAKSKAARKTPVTAVCFRPNDGREFAVATACGSIQIFSASKPSTRPVRSIFDAHLGAIHCLDYSTDGRFLVSRSSSPDDDTAKVWRASSLKQAVVACRGLPTIYERANAALSPDGVYLVAGSANSHERKVEGKLHIFKLDLELNAVLNETKAIDPIVTIVLDKPPTLVIWHAKLNQIVVAAANGSASVWYSSKLSTNGAKLVKQAGRPTDGLTLLLRKNAPTGSAAFVGEIINPLENERLLHAARKKRPAQEAIMPERPAAKKLMGSQAGGTTTFQQFVADQHQGRLEQDPREALFKYSGDGSDSKLYSNSATEQPRILALKTAEQEAEESKRKK